MVRKREDVVFPFLKRSTLKEACPEVSRLEVHVLEQPMAGPDRWECVYVATPDRSGIPDFAECHNVCCTRRGAALAPRIAENLPAMVKAREVQRELKIAFCSGHEPMGRGQRRTCVHGFAITLRVAYCDEAGGK